MTHRESLFLILIIISALTTSLLTKIRKRYHLLENEKNAVLRSLIETEKEFKALFDDNLTGNLIANKDGIILDVNNSFLKMFGYNTKEEVVGRNKLVTYPDVTEYSFVQNELKSKGRLNNYQTARKKKNGDLIYISENIVAIFDSGGEIIKTKSFVFDVTNQVTAEMLLKNIESKFSKVISCNTSAFYFYRLSGEDLIFTGANPTANKIIGIQHDALVGKKIEECFPNLPDNIPTLYKKVAKGELTNQSFETKYSGDRFTGYYAVDVFRIEQNEIAVSFIDITERKIEEDRNNKLFSIISHDLRNPIANIVNFSELILRGSNLNKEKMMEYVGVLNSTAESALTLLEDLLLWSKAQTGRGEYKPEIFKIFPAVNEVLEVLSSAAYLKQINIKNSIQFDLDCYADKQMLKTVLRNLMQNSIKFTHPGGLIEVTAISEKDHVRFAVSDNGVGINIENQKKLFEVGANLSTLGTAGEKGSGLGLTICKEFVVKHGGAIWVESEIGKWSKFCFTLPLAVN
jgi:PAS domain S-box-containing protein